MKLTIIIPTYNRTRHLFCTLYAISKIISRTTSCNIIVLDNCSNDCAFDLCRDISKDFNVDISYYRWPRNTGSAESSIYSYICQYGIEALGDYILVLGDDDLPISESIRTVIEDINTLPEHSLLFFINASYSTLFPHHNQKKITYGDPEEFFSHLLSNGLFHSQLGLTFLSSVVAPKKIFLYSFFELNSSINYNKVNLPYLASVSNWKNLSLGNGVMVTYSKDLVIPAFHPIKQNKAQDMFFSVNEEYSRIDYNPLFPKIDGLWASWVTTAANLFYFNNINSVSSFWFFFSTAAYFSILLNRTTEKLEKYSASKIKEDLSYNWPLSMRTALSYYYRFSQKMNIACPGCIVIPDWAKTKPLPPPWVCHWPNSKLFTPFCGYI